MALGVDRFTGQFVLHTSPLHRINLLNNLLLLFSLSFFLFNFSDILLKPGYNFVKSCFNTDEF